MDRQNTNTAPDQARKPSEAERIERATALIAESVAGTATRLRAILDRLRVATLLDELETLV